MHVLVTGAAGAVISGHELVFHLAAKITLHRRDAAAWRLNTEGVRTVARAALAAGVARFVHCSSVHAFDTSVPGVLAERSPRSAAGARLPLYDRSKYVGEMVLHQAIDGGLPVVIANPIGVFGPPDVRDVGVGLTQVADAGRVGENYLLGGHGLEIHTAFRTATNVAGRRGPVVTLPHWLVKAIVPLATYIGGKVGSDVRTDAAMSALRWNPVVDHSKAREELGYQVPSSEQTIRELIAHFVVTGQLDRRRGRK